MRRTGHSLRRWTRRRSARDTLPSAGCVDIDPRTPYMHDRLSQLFGGPACTHHAIRVNHTETCYIGGLLMSGRRPNSDSGEPDSWSNGSVFMRPREPIWIDPSLHIPLQQSTDMGNRTPAVPPRHRPGTWLLKPIHDASLFKEPTPLSAFATTREDVGYLLENRGSLAGSP